MKNCEKFMKMLHSVRNLKNIWKNIILNALKVKKCRHRLHKFFGSHNMLILDKINSFKISGGKYSDNSYELTLIGLCIKNGLELKLVYKTY